MIYDLAFNTTLNFTCSPGHCARGADKVLEAVAGPGVGVAALVLRDQDVPRALRRRAPQREGRLVAHRARVHHH